MSDAPTSGRRALFIVLAIVGLPLAFTVIGLFVAGPFSSQGAPTIPGACGEPFVDEAGTSSDTAGPFAPIQRVRLFDCGDRFVAVVEGSGDAAAAFAVQTDGSLLSVSVALFDQFGERHEQRVIEARDGAVTAEVTRRGDDPVSFSTSDVGFEGTSVVMEFPRGRGEELLERVEVRMVAGTASVTFTDELGADF